MAKKPEEIVFDAKIEMTESDLENIGKQLGTITFLIKTLVAMFGVYIALSCAMYIGIR